MTSESACSRVWQAAAAEDGRLSERDLASFERHLAACDVCAREVRALGELQQAVQQLPVLTSTPLEQRRLWLLLMRRVNERVVTGPRASRRRGIVVAAFAAAIVLGCVLWLRAHSAATAKVPGFRITASDGAEWRTVERGASLRVVVRNGRFDVTVEKLEQGQRFLLALPDGEIEVLGTRFIVNSDAERTRSVQVIEGEVMLRLPEREVSVTLVAGDRWTVETAPARAPASPPVASVSSGAGGAPQPVAGWSLGPSASASAVEPAPPMDHDRPASPSASAIPDHATVPVSAGRDFALAMAAFSAGDYGRAEGLFLAFRQDHPGDARAEDAIFLIAVARSRRGDADGAGKMARQYLERYPSGLRRVEAERLAR